VTSAASPASSGLAHRVVPMAGRDPHESGRVATSLELLFDLTFVVAFGVAGDDAAHLLAEGHVGAALVGFGFAMFAVIWAWINFSGSPRRSTPTTGSTGSPPSCRWSA
jgi:low temperature requirement protein LtrA